VVEERSLPYDAFVGAPADPLELSLLVSFITKNTVGCLAVW
jgi:hypothetical protein